MNPRTGLENKTADLQRAENLGEIRMNDRNGHANKTPRIPSSRNIREVTMKKIIAYSAFAVLAFLPHSAGAIAIIPPAIYVVTLSFGALLANAVAIVAGWAVLLGITGKENIFGKSLSAILDIFFGSIGKIVAAVLSIFLAAWLLQPDNIVESLIAGLAAGAAYFAIQYLVSYRETRLLDKTGKYAAMKSNLVFSVLVVISTIVAVLFSLQTQLVVFPASRAGQANGLAEAQAQGLAMPYQKSSADISASTDLKESAPIIYVNPTGAGECRISIGQRTYSLQARSNCRQDPSNILETSFCPLAFELTGLPDGAYPLVGSGACEKKAQVVVENGAARLVE